MKKKLRKRIKYMYKIFNEVDNYSKFEIKLQNKYSPDIISWMWDFFLELYRKEKI